MQGGPVALFCGQGGCRKIFGCHWSYSSQHLACKHGYQKEWARALSAEQWHELEAKAGSKQLHAQQRLAA